MTTNFKTTKPKTTKPKTTNPKTTKPKTTKPKTTNPKTTNPKTYLYNGGLFGNIFQRSKNLDKIQKSLETGQQIYLDENGNVTNSSTTIVSNTNTNTYSNKKQRKEINITLNDINIIRSLLSEFKIRNYDELKNNPNLLNNIENLLTINSLFGTTPLTIILKIREINYDLSTPPLIYNVNLQNDFNNTIEKIPNSDIELYNINDISLTPIDLVIIRRFYVKYAEILLSDMIIKSNIETLLKANDVHIFNFRNPIIKNLQEINYQISSEPLIYKKYFQYEFHSILRRFSNIKIMTVSNQSITFSILLLFRNFYVKYAHELLKNDIIKNSIYSLLKINPNSFMIFSPIGNPIIKNLNNIDVEILKIPNSALQNDYRILLNHIPNFTLFTIKQPK